MTTAVRRLCKLEIRFGPKFAVPSIEQAIVERLAAGEWQSALNLLEPRDRDLWQERQSLEYRGRGPKGIDITDLTHLRMTLDISLGGLPWEVREKIAQQLLAADTE